MQIFDCLVEVGCIGLPLPEVRKPNKVLGFVGAGDE